MYSCKIVAHSPEIGYRENTVVINYPPENRENTVVINFGKQLGDLNTVHVERHSLSCEVDWADITTLLQDT